MPYDTSVNSGRSGNKTERGFITEVLGLPKLNKQELEIARQFLDEFICLPLDAIVAHSAASLCRRYKLKTPDSLIAATALLHDMPLASRDRQFNKVRELNIFVP